MPAAVAIASLIVVVLSFFPVVVGFGGALLSAFDFPAFGPPLFAFHFLLQLFSLRWPF